MTVDNYPENLKHAVNKYIEENPEAKIFYYDVITGTPYKDKSITQTTYRIYVLIGNKFKIFRSFTCSEPDLNFNSVSIDSMIAWEIKMCYEKSNFFH